MADPLRVLLLEDSPDDALLIERELRRGGFALETLRIETEGELLEALEQPWDLFIVDFGLPAYGGMAALRQIQAARGNVPLIMISGVQGEEFAVEAMRAGAHDYVNKNQLARLVPAIRRELREGELQRRSLAERERLLTELREQRDLFQAIVTNAPLGLAVFDITELRVRWANETCRLELDHPVQHPTLTGLPLEDILPGHAGNLVELFRQAAASDQIITEPNFRMEGGGRGETWWSLAIVPLPRHAQSMDLLLVAQDITAIKKVQEEREFLLAELEATIHSMADAVVVYSPQAEIIRMNPAAETMLAYSPEIRARPLHERIQQLQVETADGHPLTAEEIPVLRALQGETVTGQIFSLRPAPQRQLWVTFSAAPMRSSDGRTLGAVATVTDITPLRELQKKQELYTHTISHDLRTPLTVIHGHAQMLEEILRSAGMQAEADLHAEAIVTAAERMNAMIEDLVDAARLEGGPLQLEVSQVEIPDFLGELLQRSATGIDTARVTVEMASHLPPVPADSNRLERIVMNLLSNALKFSGNETEVRLRASVQGGEVLIAVSDQGPGIDPGDTPFIFDRFYRPKRGRSGGGVGLGLYISRMLVEAHGGRIWVESTPGSGSTFSFTLPLTAQPKSGN
jgi:PAS domain S-box-containing protein